MIKLKGMGVYGAIAIGEITIINRESTEVKCTYIDNTTLEIQRIESARKKAITQLEKLYKKALEEVGEEDAQIFEIHKMMLEDDEFIDSVIEKINTQKFSSEYAISQTSDEFAAIFSSMEDEYMRARSADVKDIAKRLSDCLNEDNTTQENKLYKSGMIVCADDLSPSETLLLDKDKVLAFVTAYGSTSSHTAILARSMNIPAIIGIGKDLLDNVKNGSTAIVDGFTGELLVEPDAKTVEDMKKKQAEDLLKKSSLKELKNKENITLDGKTIKIFANIGNIDNISAALDNDAGGIGLFRSEFLYLENDTYPTEEQQIQVYSAALSKMNGKLVIIRTLDIGADKNAPYFGIAHEDNPSMGFRAIRICLERTEIFKTQLRALYRASTAGNLAIMFPMIANKWEVEKSLELCAEVREELKKEGHKISDSIQHGIMIETPAAALISDELAPLVDFFSVGTNDLTQYTLACDRQNPMIGKFCDIHHKAVLKLIGISTENAHRHGKWIGICGELAADTSLTKEFLKMGIDELSVSPPFVLPVRAAVRDIDLRI